MTYTRTTLKKNIYTLTLSLLALVSMQSCVDSIPIPVEDVNAMLVFESDINNSNGFSAKISTSTGLTDVTATSFPTDLNVDVSYGDEDAFDLDYSMGCKCYRSDTKPISGVQYKVNASSPTNKNYQDIEAKMVFPVKTQLAELKAVRNIETDGITTLDVNVTLDGKSHSSNYYHIIPYRKVTEIVIIGGEEHERYTGDRKYLDLVDFDNNNLYIESHHNRPGFLVDFNDEDLLSNTLNLVLYTPEVIDYENEAFTKIFFEVRSVTESYYKYEIYQSRKIQSLEGGIVEAPISYGNITNGLGYFGGYTTSLDSMFVE